MSRCWTGTVIRAEPQLEESACPHCGKGVLSSDLDCPHCDLPLAVPPSTARMASRVRERWWHIDLGTLLALSGMWIWIFGSHEVPGVVVVAIPLILIGGWLVNVGMRSILLLRGSVFHLIIHDLRCPACKGIRDSDDGDCPDCGRAVHSTYESRSPESYTREASSRALPISLLLLLGVGFLSIAVVMCFGSGDPHWNQGFVIFPLALSGLLLGWAAQLVRSA